VRVGIDYRPALVNREGTGRYVRELVRGLIELDFDRNLGLFGYTLARSKFSRSELGLVDSQADLLRLPLPSRVMPWILEKMGKGVDDLVGGANVYHHTYLSPLAVREAAQVVTIFDTIYAIEGSGYLDPEVGRSMTERAKGLIERSSRVLVPTEFVGAEVVMTFGVLPGKISVTGLGCDHIVRNLPPGKLDPAREPYVLTVSRVDARKNHLRMLEAFELLVKEGLPQRWLIAGTEGFGHEVFERALADSPARDRVEWRREVSDEELPLLYAQADCFLFPSLSEGFGLPPLEAMACGTPVISSCVTSLPEVLGEAALLVEPTDSQQIFEALRRVLTEPALAEDLFLRGKQKAREHTWREAARHTLLAYQKAADQTTDGDGVRRSL
jgi:glycosyltransferase involved in cell wall biosynthesis